MCTASQLLIDSGASVDARECRGLTPLHVATLFQNVAMMKLLIRAGADVNAKDNDDHAPLHTAVSLIEDVVNVLVDAGTNLNVLDGEGCTTLEQAVKCKNLATARILLQAGASAKVREGAFGNAMHLATKSSDLALVKALIGAGFDVQTQDADGKTAMHHALAMHHCSVAEVLSDAGFDFKNIKDNNSLITALLSTRDGETEYDEEVWQDDQLHLEPFERLEPVFYCIHESSACLESLINYDVDVNLSYTKLTPLFLALAANSPACVTALVGAGAWVTREEMNRGFVRNLLQSALKMSPVPVYALRALLVTAGERVLGNGGGLSDGMPPLYWAIQHSTVDGVRVLVEGGADVNEEYFPNNSERYNHIEYAEYSVKYARSYSANSHDVTRLTAIVDYLKSQLCFRQRY